MRNCFFVLLVIIMFTPACTWVKPTDAGDSVVLAKDFNVQACRKLGSTTSRVKHNIGPIDRNQEKVNQELLTLAKNAAAEMGGDSIVAKEPAGKGFMVFDVYRCVK